MATMKFEQALARLEEIVRALEKGDLSLEESLKRFEDGVKLSKTCMKMLEEAERKVEVLITDKKGGRRIRPFDADAERNGPSDGDDEFEDDEMDDGKPGGGDDQDERDKDDENEDDQ